MFNKMRFLEGPEFVLRLISLYTEPPLKILSLEIPSTAITAFAFASLLLTYIPSVSACIVNVSDFISLLPAILVISSNFSITAIYVFCLTNRSFIIESVNQLDEYVRKSKNLKHFSSKSFNLWLLRLRGFYYFFSFGFYHFSFGFLLFLLFIWFWRLTVMPLCGWTNKEWINDPTQLTFIKARTITLKFFPDALSILASASPASYQFLVCWDQYFMLCLAHQSQAPGNSRLTLCNLENFIDLSPLSFHFSVRCRVKFWLFWVILIFPRHQAFHSTLIDISAFAWWTWCNFSPCWRLWASFPVWFHCITHFVSRSRHFLRILSSFCSPYKTSTERQRVILMWSELWPKQPTYMIRAQGLQFQTVWSLVALYLSCVRSKVEKE